MPAEKVTVQLQGISDRFRPVPAAELEEARLRLRLPRRFFLFVGTFEPRKNIPTLLESYRLVRMRLEDPPSLLIVGRVGWLFDEGLLTSKQDGVVWKTDADDRDLPAIYGLATALVLPSYYEGFGLPVLEAMACGTVPIVSGNSSLPEIVGDVGTLIDPIRRRVDRGCDGADGRSRMAPRPEARRTTAGPVVRLRSLGRTRPRPVRTAREDVISGSHEEVGGSRSPRVVGERGRSRRRR